MVLKTVIEVRKLNIDTKVLRMRRNARLTLARKDPIHLCASNTDLRMGPLGKAGLSRSRLTVEMSALCSVFGLISVGVGDGGGKVE